MNKTPYYLQDKEAYHTFTKHAFLFLTHHTLLSKDQKTRPIGV